MQLEWASRRILELEQLKKEIKRDIDIILDIKFKKASDYEDSEKKRKLPYKAGIKVINRETGKVFKSITEAARSIGVSRYWLADRIRDKVANNTHFEKYEYHEEKI